MIRRSHLALFSFAALSLVLGCGDDPTADQPKSDGTGGSSASSLPSGGAGGSGGADGAGGQGGGLISSGSLAPTSGSGGGLNWELVDSFCEKACECREETGDACVDECVDQSQGFVDAAGAQGCSEQARALLDCASTNFECPPDQSLPLHGCWPQARDYGKCMNVPIPIADGATGGTTGSGGSGGDSAPIDLAELLGI